MERADALTNLRRSPCATQVRRHQREETVIWKIMLEMVVLIVHLLKEKVILRGIQKRRFGNFEVFRELKNSLIGRINVSPP